MYHDHVSGQESEIDYINGSIVKIADENEVDVPINRLLTKAVKEIQEKRKEVTTVEEFYKINDKYLKKLIEVLL